MVRVLILQNSGQLGLHLRRVRKTPRPRRDDAQMRAMTARPGRNQTAGLEEVPPPGSQDGTLLVRGMAIGRHPEDIKVVVDLAA